MAALARSGNNTTLLGVPLADCGSAIESIPNMKRVTSLVFQHMQVIFQHSVGVYTVYGIVWEGSGCTDVPSGCYHYQDRNVSKSCLSISLCGQTVRYPNH